MGPVNWVAVVIAAAVALGISIAWFGTFTRKSGQLIPGKAETRGNYILVAVLMFVSSAMFGHSFARIGVETLQAKPWLYFMQTGGIAIAFVMPAVWLVELRNRTEPMRRVFDCAFWLVAYLAMGLVFWALG
ncbi:MULTISPECIES: DUF1761 domain-containing protein [Novosphingobium]|uniref:DUF1761 domain-containing protein n=1 Tax=Novosphingobium mathurense TaxID=428990 RepID=A0A1U6GSS6_9SPHN|nr:MULTISPECIES: DUF1761 domain-containing protein [Novosphingobium]CDO37036.1 conserved membrane hypothetical protein [Novosphingobium sp. KN65.2]SLJ86480.1 Protein of unknown function [Novosphingobium mathurense]